ncbi:hypothetical protein BHM03_00025746 [Ensete ventricosum]|nr:hypothetical protein BHM03_00025746 [Ensete ventricosum]
MTMNLKEGSRCVVNYGEDLTTVDFDDDVSLAEKEQTILLEPSSTFRLDQTIMPPQDQAPMKYADLEPMPMNLKEGNRYVVNHGECLMVVDFGGYVSLAEKRLQDGRGGRQQHDCRRLRMAWMAGDGCREERNRGGRRLEDCRGKQGSRGRSRSPPGAPPPSSSGAAVGGKGEAVKQGLRSLGVDGRPLEIRTLAHSKSASQEETVSRLRAAGVGTEGNLSRDAAEEENATRQQGAWLRQLWQREEAGPRKRGYSRGIYLGASPAMTENVRGRPSRRICDSVELEDVGQVGEEEEQEAREVTPRWIRKAARERKEVAEPTSGASKVAVGGGFLSLAASPSRLRRRQQRGEGAADARLGGSTESRDWKVSAGCGQRRWQRRLGSNRVEGNSRHGSDNDSGRGLGKQRQQGGGDCGGRGGHGWIVTIFFPKEVRSRSSTEVGSPPLLLKRCGRRREVVVSKDGVRKAPLLIGADATVVGHEEDGLVQKDTSAGEQQRCLCKWRRRQQRVGAA